MRGEGGQGEGVRGDWAIERLARIRNPGEYETDAPGFIFVN